jgi:hypothetical protein
MQLKSEQPYGQLNSIQNSQIIRKMVRDGCKLYWQFV